MPNYYTMDPGLTDEQVDELVTYLQSLKPADGCPDEDLLVGGQVHPRRSRRPILIRNQEIRSSALRASERGE